MALRQTLQCSFPVPDLGAAAAKARSVPQSGHRYVNLNQTTFAAAANDCNEPILWKNDVLLAQKV